MDFDFPVTRPTPQQVAGATKRARNRDKLIQASAFVMGDDQRGSAATVAEICEDAGVSTATFYTFYKSRDELCADAVSCLVTQPLAVRTHRPKSAVIAVDEFYDRAHGHTNLLAGALSHRYATHTSQTELGLTGNVSPKSGLFEFSLHDDATIVDELAFSLATDDAFPKWARPVPGDNAIHNHFEYAEVTIETVREFSRALVAVALFLLDQLASRNPLSARSAATLLQSACGANDVRSK